MPCENMSCDSIRDILARQILDSRGFPTVEVDVTLADGSFGRASVPSGASVGKHEAVELRDGNKQKWHAKGVSKVVENINGEIFDALSGINASNQYKIDALMAKLDGTSNKARLGANALLAVSLAVSKAAAKSKQLPYFKYLGGVSARLMPIPMMNVINGGVHADNGLDIQEFMICPHAGNSFTENLRIGVEIFHCLKSYLQGSYSVNVGDEGGFAPNFNTTKQALDAITKSIENSGYKSGEQVSIAIDSAASQFFNNGKYHLKDCPKPLGRNGLIQYYQKICADYPIYSIEDAMHEEDYIGWQELMVALGDNIQIVGDDLLVTNKKKLQQAIDNKWANAILIKPNQIGTLSETLDTILHAQKNGFAVIMSHRSGETEDNSIADIAVAMNMGQIKTGAPCRSERTAKYNQLLRIEEMLGKNALNPHISKIVKS